VPQAEERTGTMERLLVIKALPLFTDLPAEDLAVVAEHARLRFYARGDVLFSGSDQAVDSIHLVLKGRVEEHRCGQPFRMHGPLHIVGGLDALATASPNVEAVAVEDTETLSLDRNSLSVILEDDFGILTVSLQGVAAATLRTRRRLPSAGFPEPSAVDRALATTPTDLVSRIAFLRRHTLFGRMKVRTLSQLVQEARIEKLAGRRSLWRVGGAAEHAIIVIDGTLVCSTRDRQRFAAGPGTVLGLEEALATEVRWYDVRSKGPTLLLAIDRTSIIDALEDDSDSAMETLAAMATAACELRDRLPGMNDESGD